MILNEAKYITLGKHMLKYIYTIMKIIDRNIDISIKCSDLVSIIETFFILQYS